jgi:hypothetical protein
MSAMQRFAGSSRVTALVAAAGLLLVAVTSHAAGERRERPRAPAALPSTALPAAPESAFAPGFADSIALQARSPLAKLPPPPRPPAAPEPQRRKTLAYDLVRVGHDVYVHEDEVVHGDVFVLGGDLRVEGAIQGSAVVVSGGIELGSRARVGGEVVALGGRVESAPGSEVRGGAVGLSLFPQPLARGVDWRRAQHIAALVGDLVGALLMLVWTLLVSLAARRRLGRARSWLEVAPWRTTGLGVLALTGGLFAVVMGVVLLAITLVGLPLSLLVASITIVLLLVANAIGLVHFGAWLCRLLRLRGRSPFLHGTLGVLLVAAPQVAADLVRLSETGDGSSLRVAHAVLIAVAIAAGLGTLVLSRLGRYPAGPSGPRQVAGFATPPGQTPLADAPS